MNIFKSKLIIFLLIEILIIPLLFKLVSINYFFINDNETLFYRIFQTIAHDSIIYFFILLFIYLSYLKKLNYLISILFRVLSLIIFILYIIDIFILNNFATHLILEDIIKYINYTPKYLKQLYTLNILIIFAAFVGLYLIFNFIFKKYEIENNKTHLISQSIIVFVLILYFFADNGRYIHSWLYKNFIEYNYEILEQSKTYSQQFKENLSINKDESCQEKISNKKNIIVLMVESLASYQSDYFSGIKDWTPNLDKIAKENINFKNFYANGFVTEDAEIAILTGKFPIYAANTFSDEGGVSFSGFYNIKNSLPNILKEHNYNTEFITSSDLEFSNTGKWAKSLGFDYIEGSKEKFYEDKQRFHFDAAGDEFLYERVMQRVSQQNSKYFLFIKTVSSHAPFIHPQTLSRNEEDTIRYVDKYLGEFYEKLRANDFFDDGILIIVGDHHPIIPLKSEQIQKDGIYKAPALIPMILVDKSTNAKNNNQVFQQVDIFNSIKNYVQNKSCTSSWHGDFLSNSKISSQYILFRRGDQRGIITAFKDNEILNIKLNGDETKIIENKKDQKLLDKINYLRIQREIKEFNFISTQE